MGAKNQSWLVTSARGGWRLDAFLHDMLPEFSRVLLQRAIKAGGVLVDKSPVKAAYRLHGGELVSLHGEIAHPPIKDEPQPIQLELVFEDEQLAVINKPAGLVVHPGAGNRDHTLVNALLYHANQLEQLPRAGLVHRLDKDTSGLLLVGKTLVAYAALVEQLKRRQVHRYYLALCHGRLAHRQTIDQPIGRNPHNRRNMAVVESGRVARTHIRPLEHLATTSLVEASLETGRTHQIRVHMQSIGHPLVGDPLYHLGRKTPAFGRQALHAVRLELAHPISRAPLAFCADLPEDMAQLLNTLRQACQ